MKEVGIHFPLWLAKDPRFLADNANSTNPDILAQIREIQQSAPHLGGQPVCFNLLAVSITVLITILLIRGVRESASVNNLIVLLKLGVLLFVIGIGVYCWNTDRWGLAPFDSAKFAPNGWSGIAKAAGLLFFSYIGFDAVSTAAEETKKPSRDLPIGILGSLALCTVLYIAIGFVATGVVPYEDLKGKADPLNVVVEKSGIGWARMLVSAGAVLSMTAVLLVFQMGQPRILMSMSRDGLIPPLFQRVHARFGTPAVSTVLTGIVVCVFSAIANITEIVNLVNIGTLFAFVIVCVGTLVLRVRVPGIERPFRVPGIWVIAPLGVASCVYLMTTLGPENWSRLALWLVIGLNVYFGYSFPANSKNPTQRARLRRTACILFAVVCAGLAWFMAKGDEWLGAPARASTDAGAGPSVWDVWVGFPPGLAHGIAVFLGVLVLWNLYGLFKPDRVAVRP
jgi:APA family basic amino acid/polyamine antiporter